jgi:pseudouridine synthase
MNRRKSLQDKIESFDYQQPLALRRAVLCYSSFMQSDSSLPEGKVRLEKYIAHQGLASRREAKALILDGHVSVNGEIVRETGFGIDPVNDRVQLVGNAVAKETVVIFKPRGIETSKTSPNNRDIHDEFPQFAHLAPIGRLDKDSEGLILLSNDGVLAKMITGEHSDIDKEYNVTVRELVTNEALKKMERGIMLDGKKTLPAKTKAISHHSFAIILHEGRKHQIRRMADACHLTVESLKRVRVGSITLGDLCPGEWRHVTTGEI